MDDRYRYPRSRSPALYNPARASLPSNISSYSDHHTHVLPTRREVIPGPRSSGSSIATAGPITTTTYKVSSDPLARASSVRDGSRTRRSTLENSSRPPIPTIVTAAPRQHYKTVIHSAVGARPGSPVKNPYRSSEEEYTTVPASSSHGHHRHHHRKRHSGSVDKAELLRLREREGTHHRVGDLREEPAYAGRRAPVYVGTSHRHHDSLGDDYGNNGYGYTNPRDLVQYDLNNNAPARHHSSRDSYDGGRRPASISSYNDLAPRGYDRTERGPPPSTRGFDRVPPRAPLVPFEWEKQPARVAPMEPVQRPARVEPAFLDEPRRDSTRRPSSVYHERENRRPQRDDDFYEVRDEPRHRSDRPRHETRYEDEEKRVRPERSEKDRFERYEDKRRDEKKHDDKQDYKDHKGRDALAAGLSIAGAALGVKAFKDVSGDRNDDDRRRDYDDESRRRRDPRDDRETIDLEGRDPKERRPRADSHVRDGKNRVPSDESINLAGRDPKEKRVERTERDSDEDRRTRHRPSDAAVSNAGNAIDSREGSPVESTPVRSSRNRRASAGAPAPFNPKDTMDLKALKEALNNKEASPKEPFPAFSPARTPRQSMTRDSREVANIRQDLQSPEIVTPPPPSNVAAPVKGILRQPRDKFPEDPAPIREGVAPLKDAKKDGVPPDARWTKISRKLVNPEALEAGKERYEAREDFVIVLRVLSRDEVQGYAEVTERIRAAREEAEEQESRDARRKARRERHERHKRERLARGEREPSREERRERKHRRERERERGSHSDSDTSDFEDDAPKMIEAPVMSGGLGTGDALHRTTSKTDSVVSVPGSKESKR